MEPITRFAVREDIPQLVKMLVEIGALHFRGRPDIFKDCALKFDDEKINDLLNNPETPVIVAADGDILAGYAFCRIKKIANHPAMSDRSYLYIDDFFVCEEYRRRHVGSLLFDAIKLYAAEAELDKIELNVWSFNTGAVQFYESRGMTSQRTVMELPVPVIRPITAETLPAALDVIHRAFATVAAEFNLTRENCPKHTSFLPVENLQKQAERGWYMYGLFENKRLVGYAALSDEGGGTYELHNLAVLPEYRRNGYGKLLLDHAKGKVRAAGGSEIKIGIIEESTVIREWYLKNGFIHTGCGTFTHLPFTVGFMKWRNE